MVHVYSSTGYVHVYSEHEQSFVQRDVRTQTTSPSSSHSKREQQATARAATHDSHWYRDCVCREGTVPPRWAPRPPLEPPPRPPPPLLLLPRPPPLLPPRPPLPRPPPPPPAPPARLPTPLLRLLLLLLRALDGASPHLLDSFAGVPHLDGIAAASRTACMKIMEWCIVARTQGRGDGDRRGH